MLLGDRDKTELSLWRKIPHSFVINCWKKGYHWHDILQLWGWKIPIQDIPDLKLEQRIGAINSLHYLSGLPASILHDKSIPKEEMLRMYEDDSMSGFVKNLVVIIRKKPSGEPAINLDQKITKISLYGSGNTHQYTKNLITFFSQQEGINLNQYQISFLECLGAEYFNLEADIKYGTTYGKSTGSAIYLALLSAYHQKPIASAVAATGVVVVKKKKAQFNGQAIELNPGTNLPIGGIKGKIIGATKKGINKLVLSKWQTLPFISLWNKKKAEWFQLADENDYQAVVPTEVKAKIKEVYWTENIKELRDLVLQGKLS